MGILKLDNDIRRFCLEGELVPRDGFEFRHLGLRVLHLYIGSTEVARQLQSPYNGCTDFDGIDEHVDDYYAFTLSGVPEGERDSRDRDDDEWWRRDQVNFCGDLCITSDYVHGGEDAYWLVGTKVVLIERRTGLNEVCYERGVLASAAESESVVAACRLLRRISQSPLARRGRSQNMWEDISLQEFMLIMELTNMHDFEAVMAV